MTVILPLVGFQLEIEMLACQAQRVLEGLEYFFCLGGETGMPQVARQSYDERFLTRYVVLCLGDMPARLRNRVFGGSHSKILSPLVTLSEGAGARGPLTCPADRPS